jgi:hypothetical protein
MLVVRTTTAALGIISFAGKVERLVQLPVCLRTWQSITESGHIIGPEQNPGGSTEKKCIHRLDECSRCLINYSDERDL